MPRHLPRRWRYHKLKINIDNAAFDRIDVMLWEEYEITDG
jgi:hypothetical protein